MKKIFFPLSIIISANLFAQTGGAGLVFPKGQKLEMVAQTKAVISQDVMGQSMDMNVNSSIVRSFDIEEVTNGTARIEHKIKKLQFDFDVMGQSQKFDSDKPEDLQSEIGKSLEKSIKNKYSMMVDASGKIVTVKADDDNPNKADPGQDMMSNVMAQFAEGLQVPKTGDVISLKVVSGNDFAKGKTWTDSLLGDEVGTTKYTVADVNNNDVMIDYVSEGTTKRKQDAGGVEVDINIKNKTTGMITLDKKSGLLKKRTIESQGTGTMMAMGQSIPMTSKISGVITVNGF